MTDETWQADADKRNKTIGMWVRTESGLWDDLQSAAVKVTHAFYDKRISLSAFEIARETMRKEYEGLAKKLVPKANEMAESFSRKATSLAETNINVSVDDMRFLPPYSEGRDRICFTVIRKERNVIGGEKSVSFSVTSCAMLWIRGTEFSLYVKDGVVEQEADLDAAVSATREKLEKWIAAVEAANGRSSLELEDIEAKSDPGCIDPRKS